MTDTDKTGNVDRQPFWMRQAPITIVGVLLLGVVGSTVYDLLVKPGITSFGRLLLDVITLGSATLRNAAYSSAALDPTPVSALVLLQAGLFIAAFPAIRLIARARDSRDLEKIREKIEQAGGGEKEALEKKLERLKKKLRKLRLFFWSIFVPWWIGLFVAFAVHNQSVVIWRAFNANLAILAPHIASEKKSQLQAQFAAMETNSDYQSLMVQMKEFARIGNVMLRDIETW
jgi:hypothetical protein